jgi:hypothetical protein
MNKKPVVNEFKDFFAIGHNVPAVAALAVPGASRDGATFALRIES